MMYAIRVQNNKGLRVVTAVRADTDEEAIEKALQMYRRYGGVSATVTKAWND